MQPIRDTDVLDCLALARELQVNGQCKGPAATRPSPSGPEPASYGCDAADHFCAIGALSRAALELALWKGEAVGPRPGGATHWHEDLMVKTYALMEITLSAAEQRRFGTPAGLNDSIFTTKQHMLDLYERAAALVGK